MMFPFKLYSLLIVATVLCFSSGFITTLERTANTYNCQNKHYIGRPSFSFGVTKEQNSRKKSSCASADKLQLRSASSDYENIEFPNESDDSINISDESFMESLSLRITKSNVLGPGMAEGTTRPDTVYVVLFTAPKTGDEGIHTIEFPKDSGNNVILAFQSQMDCEDFADTLRDQQFFDPNPTKIPLRELEENTEPMGIEIQIVPEGTELLPPSDTVEDLNFNPRFDEEVDELQRLFQLPDEDDDDDQQQQEYTNTRRSSDSSTCSTFDASSGSWE